MLQNYAMLEVYLRNLVAFLTDEEGQDLIEYALLVALISIIAVVSITAAGESVSILFSRVAVALSDAVAASN